MKQPIGNCYLVKLDKPDLRQGLILLSNVSLGNTGTIVSIGTTVENPVAQIGDKVVTNMQSMEKTKCYEKDSIYVVFPEKDILAVIEEE